MNKDVVYIDWRSDFKGGVATERESGGGGFSGPNDKPDTDGQLYLTTIPFRVSKINFGLDAMINPRKSISGDAVKTSDLAQDAIQLYIKTSHFLGTYFKRKKLRI